MHGKQFISLVRVFRGALKLLFKKKDSLKEKYIGEMSLGYIYLKYLLMIPTLITTKNHISYFVELGILF